MRAMVRLRDESQESEHAMRGERGSVCLMLGLIKKERVYVRIFEEIDGLRTVEKWDLVLLACEVSVRFDEYGEPDSAITAQSCPLGFSTLIINESVVAQHSIEDFNTSYAVVWERLTVEAGAPELPAILRRLLWGVVRALAWLGVSSAVEQRDRFSGRSRMYVEVIDQSRAKRLPLAYGDVVTFRLQR
jgi:hypothetical protein